MELEDFSSFIGEFVEEAEENLQAFSANLIETEKKLKDGVPDKEVIGSLFRSAHTIKGLAGMMEFEGIEKLCHQIEDLLGEVRQGNLELDYKVVDTLFEALEILTRQIAAVKSDKTDKGIDTGDVIQNLANRLEGIVPKKTAQSEIEQEILKNLELDSYSFDEKERELLADAVKARLSIYEVAKEIAGGSSREKVDELPVFRLIAQFGILISVNPSLESISMISGAPNCKILFGSSEPMRKLKEKFSDPLRLIKDGETDQVAAPPEPEQEEAESELDHLLKSHDDSVVKEYLLSSNVLLDSLDLDLLVLENEGSNKRIIGRIHDTLAELRNLAESCGFSKIVSLTGTVEDLFGEIRSKGVAAEGDLLETVFDCMEKLKLLLGEIRLGKDSGCEIQPELEMVEKITADKSAAAEPARPELAQPEPPTLKPSSQAGDTPDEKSSLVEEPGKKIKEKGVETIRVEIDRLDKLLNRLGELVIDRTRFEQTGAEMRSRNPHDPIAIQLTETNQLFQRHLSDIQELVMSVRMVPISNVLNRFPRIARDLAKSLGKSVEFVIDGEDTELDKTLVEEISEPLLHLIRNALDHGIETPEERIAAGKGETGTVEIKARHEGDNIIIEISDDGRGMDIEKIRQKGLKEGLVDPGQTLTDREIVQLIFEPGFSTADKPTMVSGRGVGMDVVKGKISRLKGIIEIDTRRGEGSKILIRLPLTLAIMPALVVGVAEETYAIPLSSVVESIRISPDEIDEIQGKEVINLRDSVLPLVRLDKVFELHRKKKRLSRFSGQEEHGNGKGRKSVFIVVLGIVEKRLGLVVHELKNQQEMVIKKLGNLLKDAPGISGAAVLGDGKVCLILDVGEIVAEAFRRDRPDRVTAEKT